MTINELIKRLQEMGDEKWRDTAEVRICTLDGEELSDSIDAFDVKYDVRWCDINIDCPPLAAAIPDEEYDDWDDVDDEDEDWGEDEEDPDETWMEKPVS